jgi:MoaA/NifB/PqqE/SkfB family radical SAM enzyme
LDSQAEPKDQRHANIGLNAGEFEERKLTLESTPKLVTLGTHNACNAKCVFCLEGSYSRFSLDIYKEFFEARMARYIHNAEKVTFTGFGELLWIPGIEEFLDYINETIPNVWKIFTTNGTPLRPSVVERIVKSKYVIQVSLHASNAKLHKELTQLDNEFDNIIANVQSLADLRDANDLGRQLHIVLFDVLTNQNIDDLPELLKLAWRLRVQEVRAMHVTMFVPEHIKMSCFFEQERANRAILEARRVADLLQRGAGSLPTPKAFRVDLPPLFDKAEPEGSSKGICSEPWQHVYVELQGSVIPCCFWGEHVGNLKKGDELDAVWNGDFYKSLRKGMAGDDPHPWCKSCIRYRGYSVNSVYCHMTNRPHQQAELLKEILRRGLDAGPYFHAGDLERLAASRPV